MLSPLKIAGVVIAILVAALGVMVAVQSHRTEADIGQFEARVSGLAKSQPVPTWDATRLSSLPAPVQRYLRFTFVDGVPSYAVVRLSASGQFRRPQTDGFKATTARQVIAAGTPALMFSATTPIVPGVWARAYDYFANGQMEMKAKILSTLTVVD